MMNCGYESIVIKIILQRTDVTGADPAFSLGRGVDKFFGWGGGGGQE